MIDLRVLTGDELAPVYAWDRPYTEETWEEYRDILSAPQWVHYGVFEGMKLEACISIEKLHEAFVGVHVTKRPGGIAHEDLRDVIVALGKVLFESGISTLWCHVAQANKGALRLVAACGMEQVAENETNTVWELKAETYFANPEKWNGQQDKDRTDAV